MSDSNMSVYKAWDLNTRLFHWINFLCVFVLSILGLIMLNKSSIGISGDEATVGLKALHAIVGYVFAINLIIRIISGFIGSRHSRFSTLIPGKNFRQELKSFTASVASGQPQTFVGHNPKGRLSTLVMLLLLTVIMVTGMVRAGTDIYYPPFGSIAASYVAAEGVSPSQIKAYDNTGTDVAKMAKLDEFLKPYGTIHLYGTYILWLLILIHLIAVIRVDAGGQGTIISSMFSGKKYLPRKPEDV